MGFFVPQFDLKEEKKPQAGQDAVPPDHTYKTLINLHGNHSNLEGMYDPRRRLPESYIEPEISRESKRADMRRFFIVAACLVLSISTLLYLYAIFVD